MSQNNPYPAHKLFNLNLLCELTGISKDKLYKNMMGKRDTFTNDQKKEIFQILENGLADLKSQVLNYDDHEE